MAFRSLLLLLGSIAFANAVTVYNQIPLGVMSASQAEAATATATDAAPQASYTGLEAYNPATLTPPPIPNPPPPTQFQLALMPTADLVGGISIQTPSSFFGFSIEMSVATQVSEYHSLFNSFSGLVSRRSAVTLERGAKRALSRLGA